MKIELEIKDKEELNNFLYGISLGGSLMGEQLRLMLFGCEHSKILDGYTDKNINDYFLAMKEFYHRLDKIYGEI